MQLTPNKRKLLILITALFSVTILILICLVYAKVNPANETLAPKCPTYYFLGIRCPGCGTQRALHSLLNGDIVGAIGFNPLIIISIPYVLLLMAMEFCGLKKKYNRLYNVLYGVKSIYIMLIVLFIYTVLRNIFEF